MSLPTPLLQGTRREFAIEYLLRVSDPPTPLAAGERRLLCWVLPPWQRAEVWTIAHKQRFIEGIFLGLGTGYYVVNQLDWDNDGRLPMSGWLLDGQQRLTALRDFAAGEFEIFDGLRYATIGQVELRRRFLNVVFPCIEIAYQTDEHVLRELYDRLNFGGVAHTDADRLKAAPQASVHDGYDDEPADGHMRPVAR